MSSAKGTAHRVRHAIGVDIGGTKIAAGLVSFPSGHVVERQQIPTEAVRGGKAVLADVVRLCQEIASRARTRNITLDGVGVGICELVDREGNILSQNCIAWKDLHVKSKLSKIAPTTIEADVRAAALAEAQFGAGKAFHQFLYVTVGTGISSCLMLDGKPFTGARGLTGTMASNALSVACPHCQGVNQRTLEEIASGPGLVGLYNRLKPGTASNAQQVLAAALDGDTDAQDVVRAAGRTLGFTVGWLVNVVDPEAVIVGGGLGLSKGLFWDSFEAATRQHIWSEINRDLPIMQAGTGLDAGLIGAAAASIPESNRNKADLNRRKNGGR